MKELNYELVILGGGPAGMAAALAAHKLGINSTIIERDDDLGGILQQCIHPGFGLHIFNEELTGPEFGERYKDMVLEKGVKVLYNTIVTGISPNKVITCYKPDEGLLHIQAKAIILTMGARERTRGALKIPGSRPSGVYTAGLAQRWINVEGKLPGKNIVILGSGDIGMIMARRLALEGAKVIKVVEVLPYPSGLLRNKIQCLDDFSIPLLLEHTVTHIHGKERLEGVSIAKVDSKWIAIPGTEEYIPCDTLLLSVGLVPEIDFALDAGIELSSGGGPIVDETLETTVSGIFAAGNVLHIHDLVDNVVIEGTLAGTSAVRYLKEGRIRNSHIPINSGDGVLYVVPHRINPSSLTKEQAFQLRVRSPASNIKLGIFSGSKLIKQFKIKFAIPSEMIKLTLTALDDLSQIKEFLEIRVVD